MQKSHECDKVFELDKSPPARYNNFSVLYANGCTGSAYTKGERYYEETQNRRCNDNGSGKRAGRICYGF